MTKRQKWYKQNIEKIRTWQHNYYIKKRAKIINQSKKWRKLNYEKYVKSKKLWQDKNKIRYLALAKKSYLKRTYNLTAEEKAKIFLEQGNVCAGCKRPQSDFKHTFAIDHDHSTRIIRGILCWRCNTMLPNRKNIKELFHNLLKYLENPPAIRVIGERKANPIKRRKRK